MLLVVSHWTGRETKKTWRELENNGKWKSSVLCVSGTIQYNNLLTAIRNVYTDTIALLHYCVYVCCGGGVMFLSLLLTVWCGPGLAITGACHDSAALM